MEALGCWSSEYVRCMYGVCTLHGATGGCGDAKRGSGKPLGFPGTLRWSTGLVGGWSVAPLRRSGWSWPSRTWWTRRNDTKRCVAGKGHFIYLIWMSWGQKLETSWKFNHMWNWENWYDFPIFCLLHPFSSSFKQSWHNQFPVSGGNPFELGKSKARIIKDGDTKAECAWNLCHDRGENKCMISWRSKIYRKDFMPCSSSSWGILSFCMLFAPFACLWNLMDLVYTWGCLRLKDA